MSRSDYPVMQHRIPEEWNPRPHCVKSLHT